MTEREPLKAVNEKAATAMTPSRKRPAGKSKIMSSIKKKGGKLRKVLTPPRENRVGCTKTPMRKKGQILTFSPRFENASLFERLKTSEFQPSEYQIEPPSFDSTIASCKICNIMDSYVDELGVDFDFADLMPFGGSPKQDIHMLLMGEPAAMIQKEKPKDSEFGPILEKLKDVASDIVVEGFYRDHASSKEIGRVEICIFSSESLRQIIVVYRGSSLLQDHPKIGAQKVKKDEEKKKDGKDGSYESDVNDMVMKAYEETNLEESVFTLLNRLTGFKPFFDVAFTGHSFGACLGSIAAYKYAKSKPASRIRATLFGCPKIGGQKLRNEIHSLPNLNILRVERSTDPFVSFPEGHENDYIHVGHSMQLEHTVTSLTRKDDARPIAIKLYKFDKNRPASNFFNTGVNMALNFSKIKIGNEVRSYLKDLQKVSNLNLGWPQSFEVIEASAQKENFVEHKLPVGYLA